MEKSILSNINKVKNDLRELFYKVRYPRLQFGNDVFIYGFPRIYSIGSQQILVGKKVVLDSSPKGYHAGMAFPVTLIADKPGSNISIGEQSRLHGCCIHAWSQIEIGKRCLIASGVQIIDANGHDTVMKFPHERVNTQDSPEPIIIEDDCWIGLNAIILKGVHLGHGSIVSAGSVGHRGVYPPKSIVIGNPAKVFS